MEPNSDNLAGENEIFDDADRASDKNPMVAMKDLLAEGRAKPKIYMACGLSDSLLEVNHRYRDLLRDNGFDVTYDEEPGGHEWDFWDRQIEKVLHWLPLSEGEGSLNSGNVRAEDPGK